MGINCPKHGNSHQPIVENLTFHGGPAVSASDVIARRLGCGCVYDENAFKSFTTKRNEILADYTKRRMALDEERNAKLAATVDNIRASGSVE